MILLTGVTGKSGRWFLKELAESDSQLRKSNFRAIVRETSNVALLDNSGLLVEKEYGDLTDEALLDRACKGARVVFHIAGIRMSLKVVEAAIRNNAKWIILVHTTGIYSKYKSASAGYLEIESQIEAMTAKAGIPVTILRPTMIYGCMQDMNLAIFIKMVDKLKIFPVVSRAEFLLQPVHEKDLGRAYFQVLCQEETTKGKNYTLSGESPIMLIDIFKTIGRALGKKNFYISVPFLLAFWGSYLIYIFSFGKFDYREKVQRLVEPRFFSYEDASRDFGYAPMPFEEGIVGEVEEYLESTRPSDSQ